MIDRDPHTGRYRPPAPPHPGDAALHLARLRAEFPTFGIIADPRRPLWMAVKGDLVIKAPDSTRLRRRLLAISGR
ncbi:hypothetical protein [Thermomonospora cellulosilytica]|uniref:Uncharacterized protein n=1 Tax=Thermomonospora cellulosilytica TaxID=1411118 RepID=A0A7W3R958_9ACTN|nr:hypothetical protein [Thermomonospora cellulosilytica]MBA9005008.1 hypothetical protein [Thermomonospora cellulosilytica]